MYEAESVWEFEMVDRVKFGTQAIQELPALLADESADSVALITDQDLKDTPVIETVETVLRPDVDVEIYAEVSPDPSATVMQAARETIEQLAPDALVAVGGGSVIDVTKTASVLAGAPGEILDYVAPPTGGGQPVPTDGIPTIAVPTTAGTGSETSPVSVISLPDEHLKVGISSRHQRPDTAVIDPTLMVSLPPGPTASSGIDALAHAIEAYTTRRFDAKPRPASPADRPDYNGRNLLTDQFARKAIELIGDNLRRAVNNGEDLAARRGMAAGSLLAGVAFTNAGLGATHAIAMAVGAEFDTPHGTTIGAALPAVMRYNASSAPERYREIGSLLDTGAPGNGDDRTASGAAEWVARLVRDTGLPDGLGALGVEESDIDVLVEKTLKLERLLVGNPRRIDADALETIYRDAL